MEYIPSLPTGPVPGFPPPPSGQSLSQVKTGPGPVVLDGFEVLAAAISPRRSPASLLPKS